MAAPKFFLGLIRECWNEDPLLRPDFKLIRDRTKKNLKQGKKTNIVDQMMEKMDKYTNNLEDLVAARTKYVYLGQHIGIGQIHQYLTDNPSIKIRAGEFGHTKYSNLP